MPFATPRLILIYPELQYRQDSTSNFSCPCHPWHGGRSHRLLARTGNLWEVPQGRGATLGGGKDHLYNLQWWIERFFLQGAGHNDVELYNQYLERLKTFVAHELTNWQPARGEGDCPTPKASAGGCNGSKNAKKRVLGAPRDSSIDSTATVSTNSGGSKPENPSEKLL